MTDEELGRKVVGDMWSKGYDCTDTDKTALGATIRTLLAARPEVTQAAVHEWVMNRRVGQALEVHVWDALSHFAPPPASLPPICGMSVEDWHEAFKPIYAGNNEFRKMDHAEACAIIAHRLAQPAPVVDPDAEAKRLAWIYYEATPGPGKFKTPEEYWEDGDEEVQNGWRAVAKEKADCQCRKEAVAALTAADAAMAVTDEELDEVLTGVRGGIVAQLMREKLRAAGLKVVRA